MQDTEMEMNLETLLDGIDFPATKSEIVTYADDQGASEEALEAFRALPKQSYNSFYDVNSGLGMIESLPGNENLFSSKPMKNKDYGALS
jgi:hypothetical protein